MSRNEVIIALSTDNNYFIPDLLENCTKKYVEVEIEAFNKFY
jgi:hypothetical protein